ncbi:DUF1330 domain-containing protein [Spirillospora sp. NPDC048911]|uniref:DUF1330 domain-containing protein n=1 Tax=Spirillospora sp. NPDC048911 TaxID=3364527 RepID=UPI00371785E6
MEAGMDEWAAELRLNAEDVEALERVADMDGPVVVVNLFALRDQAEYDDDRDKPCSGVEAMLRYSAVSETRLAAAGGRFVHRGFGGHAIWGRAERWDLVVVAQYPTGAAVLELFRDPLYLAAYRHRRAAMREQRLILSPPLP